MVDIQESPAVPPLDPGGDVRYGYLIAGSVLIVLGWGLGVVTNLVVHYLAGSGGMTIAGHDITSTLGPYAWATFGFGLFTGALGVVLLTLGRASPTGRFVLPGYDY